MKEISEESKELLMIAAQLVKRVEKDEDISIGMCSDVARIQVYNADTYGDYVVIYK